jgi:hypothetical protein
MIHTAQIQRMQCGRCRVWHSLEEKRGGMVPKLRMETSNSGRRDNRVIDWFGEIRWSYAGGCGWICGTRLTRVGCTRSPARAHQHHRWRRTKVQPSFLLPISSRLQPKHPVHSRCTVISPSFKQLRTSAYRTDVLGIRIGNKFHT